VITDPTQRFSDRADSYARARPDYPPEVLDIVEEVTGLPQTSRVADVGSGTGIFTRLLLERGYTVYAVEPNAPMRLSAEAELSGSPGFHSVEGRAEATTLPDASVELVTAAQAFHWFDVAATRREWERILRAPRWVALVWNDRTAQNRFNDAYEGFLLHWGGQEYVRVRRSWTVDDKLPDFFGAPGWVTRAVANAQRLDLPGLEGRLLSSSYLPGPQDPRRQPMLAAARDLFERHHRDDVVTLEYETRVYLGKL
jgi:SAM-dependent methyltransferase